MELLTTKGLKNHSTICTMKKKVLLLVTELRVRVRLVLLGEMRVKLVAIICILVS
jgi:hypothetical protein